MINTSISYDDGILEKDSTYAIGTNDGKEFRSVVYKGTKLLNGKPMMVFVTKDSQRLTVNPSFHTFTITENKGDSNE
jgi:putative NADPH-quinone reductase